MRRRFTRLFLAAVLALTFAFGIAGSAAAAETCITSRTGTVYCFEPRT